jgi:hypothetical protein
MSIVENWSIDSKKLLGTVNDKKISLELISIKYDPDNKVNIAVIVNPDTQRRQEIFLHNIGSSVLPSLSSARDNGIEVNTTPLIVKILNDHEILCSRMQKSIADYEALLEVYRIKEERFKNQSKQI